MFESPGLRSASVGSPLAKSDLGGSIGPNFSPKQSALGKHDRAAELVEDTAADVHFTLRRDERLNQLAGGDRPAARGLGRGTVARSA